MDRRAGNRRRAEVAEADAPCVSVFRSDLYAGQRVLVTGGATGIGLGIARAFARHGADLVIASRNEERLRAATEALRADGARASYHVADVRDAERLSSVAAEAGRINVLVNAAAGNFPALFADMSPNAFASVVDIVLTGTANACRAFGPGMRKDGGAVLNILAGYAWTGAPGMSHSGAAKAAVLNLTRSLAVEWAPEVRVNAVSPGPIEGTEGVRRLSGGLGLDTLIRDAVPLGRFGDVDDIANACMYLASDAAKYMTGACLVVDGGQDVVGPYYALYRALSDPSGPSA